MIEKLAQSLQLLPPVQRDAVEFAAATRTIGAGAMEGMDLELEFPSTDVDRVMSECSKEAELRYAFRTLLEVVSEEERRSLEDVFARHLERIQQPALLAAP